MKKNIKGIIIAIIIAIIIIVLSVILILNLTKKKIAYTIPNGEKINASYENEIYKGLESFKKEANILLLKNDEVDKNKETIPEKAWRIGPIQYLAKIVNNESLDLLWTLYPTNEHYILDFIREYPDTHFALIDCDADTSLNINTTTLSFKLYEAAFLAGATAATLTKSNDVGFIGGMDTPEVNQLQNAYFAGAKYVNENIILSSELIGDFENETKAYDLAKKMYNSNTDIIFHYAKDAGNGIFKAAVELQKYVIGSEINQSDKAPENVITSAVKNPSKGVEYVTNLYLEKENIKAKNYDVGLEIDSVGLTKTKFMDEKLIENLTMYKNKIVSREINIPSLMKEFEF